MYRNQTTIDNDLQTAIDYIANSSNSDPAFSDPVAAPSPAPLDESAVINQLSDQNINNPQDPTIQFSTVSETQDFNNPNQFSTPAPVETSTTVEEVSIPEPPQTPPKPTIPEPTIPTPESIMPTPELITPEPIAPAPIAPEPEPITPEPIQEEVEKTSIATAPNLSTRQIKEAALRDLVPLFDHIDMSPSQKFNICRNIFEDLRDYTVLEQAYRVASEIPDDSERAEALLYLVKAIDKM